jgi:hypothetical protein
MARIDAKYKIFVDRKDQGFADISLMKRTTKGWQEIKLGYSEFGGWDDAIPWNKGLYDGDVRTDRFNVPAWTLPNAFADRFGIDFHAKLGASPTKLPISFASFGCIVAHGQFLKNVKKIVGANDLDFHVTGFNPKLGFKLSADKTAIMEGETAKLRVGLTGDATGVSKDCYVLVQQKVVPNKPNAAKSDYRIDTNGVSQDGTPIRLKKLFGQVNESTKTGANPTGVQITTKEYFVKIKAGTTFTDINISALKDADKGSEFAGFSIVDYYFDSPNKVGGHRYYSDYGSPKVLLKNSKDLKQTIEITDKLQSLNQLMIQKSGGVEGFSGTYKAEKGFIYTWNFNAYSVPDSLTISDNTGTYATLSSVSGVYSNSFQLKPNSNGVIKIQVTGSEAGTVWDLGVSGSAIIAPDPADPPGIPTVVVSAPGRATDVSRLISSTKGNDRIDGSIVKELLQGGRGNDTFVFNDELLGRKNADRIADLKPGADVIHLAHNVFSALKTGRLGLEEFHIGPKAHDAETRIIYDNKKGALFYDPDGTGATKQIEIATLQKNLQITNKDFFVI